MDFAQLARRATLVFLVVDLIAGVTVYFFNDLDYARGSACEPVVVAN